MSITVAQLYCYPVKSCRGFSLRAAEVGRMGIRHDRQWVVVDEQGTFVAQRSAAGMGIGIRSMCLIETSLDADTLTLAATGMSPVSVPLREIDGQRKNIVVWKSPLSAIDQGDEVADWLSRYLSRERPGNYRLVRMPDDGVRKALNGDGEIAFSDESPFLVVSRSSLDDLNKRLAEPLPMNRFRPNIVLDGSEPYEEDTFSRIQIGDIEFVGTTRCGRCPIPTINQETAVQGKEPLTTLATYRKTEKGGVVFGSYFNHVGSGTIQIGDAIRVVERRK